MPQYTYKCPNCNTIKDLTLSMGHENPTCKDLEECVEADCSKDTKLQRIYKPVADSWKCGRPTDSSSATKEKNNKIKKLYNDSYVGMDNYDKPTPKNEG
jgi:hypothetical protein